MSILCLPNDCLLEISKYLSTYQMRRLSAVHPYLAKSIIHEIVEKRMTQRSLYDMYNHMHNIPKVKRVVKKVGLDCYKWVIGSQDIWEITFLDIREKEIILNKFCKRKLREYKGRCLGCGIEMRKPLLLMETGTLVSQFKEHCKTYEHSEKVKKTLIKIIKIENEFVQQSQMADYLCLNEIYEELPIYVMGKVVKMDNCYFAHNIDTIYVHELKTLKFLEETNKRKIVWLDEKNVEDIKLKLAEEKIMEFMLHDVVNDNSIIGHLYPKYYKGDYEIDSFIENDL